MKEYDIRAAFEEIEIGLIESMKRNLDRHKKWENDEGINWSMWQVEQLKTLEEFKRKNQKIFSKKFSVINQAVKEVLKDTYTISGFQQEREILEVIAKNKNFTNTVTKGLEGAFFSLDEDKINALINATIKDMSKAEHAVLRMVNDQYRKTIFKAQAMSNSGAFTLQQSIDAATKDFLKAGINCVQYKNGRRVNIASYSEMSLRTSTKRAKLVAEGDARNANGIHTVKISKYGQCSETCLPWQGRVYVDDVYSGGTKEEATEKNLPLLSEAIASGLFHPNCKHISYTYFYDFKKSLGKLQEDGIENPLEEQEHHKNQLHIQQQKRLEKGSLDPQNIKEAKVKKEQWIEKDEELTQQIKDEAKPKKEYMTENKLKLLLSEIDKQISVLEKEFDNIPSDDLTKLKDIHSQMESMKAQKSEWQSALDKKLIKKQKKILLKEEEALESQKKLLQQKINDIDIKTYSGIWIEDKTTADWASLNIEGKKKYYEGKFITETDPELIKKYKELYKQLEELDLDGANYNNIQKELGKIESSISKIQSELKNITKNGIINNTEDAFSQERKNNALWAKTTKEADSALRQQCGEVWKKSSQDERNAIYEYTTSYHKFNEPLRGIEYGTNAYKGVGNVDLDQIGVSYSCFKKGQVHKEINAMTSIIGKSTYDFDIWVQRGCNYGGMDKFLNVSMDKLYNSSQTELENMLLNQEIIEYGFCSCGVAKGKGFSNNPIILNIYAPKGTQMMYAEPFSAFGSGKGLSWDGVSKQNSYGQESEIILQQGTKFRIKKIEKSNGILYFDLDVIDQNPQR